VSHHARGSEPVDVGRLVTPRPLAANPAMPASLANRHHDHAVVTWGKMVFCPCSASLAMDGRTADRPHTDRTGRTRITLHIRAGHSSSATVKSGGQAGPGPIPTLSGQETRCGPRSRRVRCGPVGGCVR
jgi:hypothetical protein